MYHWDRVYAGAAAAAAPGSANSGGAYRYLLEARPSLLVISSPWIPVDSSCWKSLSRSLARSRHQWGKTFWVPCSLSRCCSRLENQINECYNFRKLR